VERGTDFRVARVADLMTREPRQIAPDRLAIDCVEAMERARRSRSSSSSTAPAGSPARCTCTTSSARGALMDDGLVRRARGVRLVTFSTSTAC